MSMVRRPDTAFALDRSDKTTKRIEDPAHLAFIRTLPSVVSGQYGVEACHLRFGDPRHRKPKTAMGRKPDDWFVLPLTSDEHREQHKNREHLWWMRQGIDDPCEVARQLYAATGDLEEAIEIITKLRETRR